MRWTQLGRAKPGIDWRRFQRFQGSRGAPVAACPPVPEQQPTVEPRPVIVTLQGRRLQSPPSSAHREQNRPWAVVLARRHDPWRCRSGHGSCCEFGARCLGSESGCFGADLRHPLSSCSPRAASIKCSWPGWRCLRQTWLAGRCRRVSLCAAVHGCERIGVEERLRALEGERPRAWGGAMVELREIGVTTLGEAKASIPTVDTGPHDLC